MPQQTVPLDATQAALEFLLERCEKGFTVIDIGARWGVLERWERLGSASNILCFEPDPAECERLNSSTPPYVRCLPYGLAEFEGERDIYVTKNPGCSSLYKPREILYAEYPCLDLMTLMH